MTSRIRRLFRRLKMKVAADRWSYGFAGIIVGALVLALVFMAMRLPTVLPPTEENAPTFTFQGEWNLLELQRHIAAGDVASISINKGQAGRGVPIAPDAVVVKTSSGQLIKIVLDVAPVDAVVALHALGYGSLLTNEAIDAVVVAKTPNSTTPEPVSLMLMVAMAFGVMLLLRIFIKRNPATSTGSAGFNNASSSSSFQIIEPPSPDAERTGPPPTLMADVAGIEEAKGEVVEIVEFLKDPARFTALGAKIPRGLLFYGPPGTGKTLLAKAIASEAGVPCIIASGAQFTEMYVGVGPKRVRELFTEARRRERCIVFIDEFDAMAQQRGGPNHNSEDGKTLNELLTQLDGFATTDTVIVIGATNRLDTLDPAAVRSGRFARKIHVPMPDREARRKILEVHARNKPFASDADLDVVAANTAGMAGADLAELLNESAILAARRGSVTINAADLRAGWLKVAMGTGRSRSMPVRERSIIAAHEAGHAVCGRVHGSKTKVAEVSLFAHGMAEGEALGFTLSVPDDNALPGESDLWADLVALMGGRAAESELFHEITPGASNDFQKANHIATLMVTRWGMGHDPDDGKPGHHGRGRRLSLRISDERNRVSPETAEAMERAINDILDRAYAEAVATVRREMPKLTAVAAYLFANERMDGKDFERVFSGEIKPTQDEIEAWRAGSAAPRTGIKSLLPETPTAKLAAKRVPTVRRRRAPIGAALRGLSAVAATAAERVERRRGGKQTETAD